MHYAGAFWPSVRPMLQFQTRYSQFLWAPDVKDPDEATNAKSVVTVPSGNVESVTAMRPYYYEEDQQPVQTRLTPTEAPGEARVELPPFRYHTMVVFRVKGSG